MSAAVRERTFTGAASTGAEATFLPSFFDLLTALASALALAATAGVDDDLAILLSKGMDMDEVVGAGLTL